MRKLVFASSMAVYAEGDAPDPVAEDDPTEPISPYGIAKLAAEKYCLQICREMGIDCHVLRYFNTFGPGQTFTPVRGCHHDLHPQTPGGRAPIILGDGEQRRDFVHVDDMVVANLRSMRSPTDDGVFNVGTGRATSVNEIAALLCTRLSPGCRPDYREAHAGELRYSIADIRRISADLAIVLPLRLPDENRRGDRADHRSGQKVHQSTAREFRTNQKSPAPWSPTAFAVPRLPRTALAKGAVAMLLALSATGSPGGEHPVRHGVHSPALPRQHHPGRDRHPRPVRTGRRPFLVRLALVRPGGVRRDCRWFRPCAISG